MDGNDAGEREEKKGEGGRGRALNGTKEEEQGAADKEGGRMGWERRWREGRENGSER